MTKSFRISKLVATMLSALTACSAYAVVDSIPLTLDEARAVAEQDSQNSISVGAYYTQANGASTSAAKSWNGAAKQKGGADVDLHYAGGTQAQGWDLNVEDFGSPIPSLSASYSKASAFDVSLNYQRIRHLKGEDVLIKPAYSTATLTSGSNSGLEPVELGVTRDIYGLNGRVFLQNNLMLNADYTLQHRNGSSSLTDYRWTRALGREYVTSIDDNHHQFETGLTFKGDQFVTNVKYYLSKYDNDEYLVDVFGYVPAVRNSHDIFNGYLHSFGAEPSNVMHQISMDTVLTLSERSSLSLAAGYTWSKNSSDSVYGDQNPAQFLLIDAQTETKIPTFSARYTAAPIDQLSVNVDYSYKKIDTSSDWLSSQIQTLEGSSSRFNPSDYSEHKLSGDAIYSLGSGYSIKAYGSYMRRNYDDNIGYENEDYVIVEHTNTYKVGAQLRKRMGSLASGTIGYEFSGRSAQNWGTVLESYPTLNNPWNFAGYTQNQVKGTLVLTPAERLTLSANGSVYLRDYKNHEHSDDHHGVNLTFDDLQESNGFTLGLDADLAVTRDLSLFAFYDFDFQKLDVIGKGGHEVGQSRGVLFDHGFESKDMTHTIGLGFNLHPVAQPWKLSIQYVYSFDQTKWNAYEGYVSATNAISIPDYPAVSTKTIPTDKWHSHYLQAKGSYELNKNWTLKGVAVYGRASSTDSRQTGVYMGTAADITYSPNYNFGAFFVGATYKF